MRPFHAVLVLAVCAVPVWAKKSSNDVKSPKPGKTERVIVTYSRQPDAKHQDKVTRSNGKVARKFNHVPAVVYEVNAAALEELENDNDVESITPDRPLYSTGQGEVLGAVRYWSVNNWYAAGSCKGCTNGQVGIAILDSGVQPNHADFYWWGSTNSRIVYNESFVDSNPADQYGHGTHVAGIAAGEGNVSCLQGGLDSAGDCRASDSFWGASTGSSIINLKVLNSTGQGSDSAVIAAIDRAIQLKNVYNIRVMNLSLGRPVRESYKTDPLCLAVERAWNAGIVVVVAAGNMGRANEFSTTGYGTITSPANHPKVITVGAANTLNNWWDADDRITTYSSKGPTAIDHVVKPDLVAPGNRIIAPQAANSWLPNNYPANKPAVSSYWPWASGASPYYFYLSGTSMAAPLVSGTAALMIDRDPTITPDIVKARLMKTARRSFAQTLSVYEASTNQTYNLTQDMFTVGAGMLDVGAAFYNNDRPSGSAASPKAVYNSTNKTVSLNFSATGGTNVIWGTTGTFSTNVVWGTNVIWGTNVVWGTNVIWGTSGTSGFNVIWGTSSPWASSSAQAEALSVAIHGDK